MPQYILRPDGVISSGWNLNGAASANAALNGTAVQPTAGETTLFISANGSGTTTEVTVGTASIGTETVTSVVVWEYGKADGVAGGHTFQAYKGTTALGTAGSTPDSGAQAWRSSTYTGSLTQAEVDDLRIRFVNGAGGLGSNYAHEAYIEVNTTAAATQVASTRTVKYDIANLVSSTRTVKYDIQAMVAATRALKYDIANLVAATRTVKYDIANLVSLARTVRWDILSSVASQRTVKYDMSGGVSATRVLRYDIANVVNAARVLRYNIGNVVAAGFPGPRVNWPHVVTQPDVDGAGD